VVHPHLQLKERVRSDPIEEEERRGKERKLTYGIIHIATISCHDRTLAQ
jgi:hypothetical protein